MKKILTLCISFFLTSCIINDGEEYYGVEEITLSEIQGCYYSPTEYNCYSKCFTEDTLKTSDKYNSSAYRISPLGPKDDGTYINNFSLINLKTNQKQSESSIRIEVHSHIENSINVIDTLLVYKEYAYTFVKNGKPELRINNSYIKSEVNLCLN